MESRAWSNLPDELLDMILSHLPLHDHHSFALVCNNWYKVTAPVCPADDVPLLVHLKKKWDGLIHYYSPSSNKIFKVNSSLDLSQARLYFSRDGWLLLYRDHEIILVNATANKLLSFPGLENVCKFIGIAFVGCGYDNCIIFAIESSWDKYVDISIWDHGGWNEQITYSNNLPFRMSPGVSPVVSNNCFYCLGMEGNIGVYDPKKEEWTILARPKKFPYKTNESYLVESKGQIFAILVRICDPQVQVVWLNQKTMQWNKVNSLGSNALFAGPRVSLLKHTNFKGMRNSVNFARLLGSPETVKAKIVCSEGRIFFVPIGEDFRKSAKGVDREATDEGELLSYRFESEEWLDYCGSYEYPNSIWYESSIQDVSLSYDE